MLVGIPVVSYDGQYLGVVAEEADAGLCIKSEDGKRQWLRRDAVFDTQQGRVSLICYASGIHRWLLE